MSSREDGKPEDAVQLEDEKRAAAIEHAAVLAKQEKFEAAAERREIRIEDARTASDIRDKDYKRIMLTIVLASIPTFITAIGGLYVITNQVSEVKSIAVGTHQLVNSGSLVQLRVIAVLSREKADRTMNIEDMRIADEAEKAVMEHVAKQKLADDATAKLK
jgi:hypothetical protein